MSRNASESIPLQNREGGANKNDYNKVFSKYVKICCRHVVVRKEIADEVDGLYEETYSCWPPPIGIAIISLVQVLFFIWDDVLKRDSDLYGPLAKIFIYNPYKRQEAWRYLTYMFVHVGYTHLIPNILIQMLLGVPLEMVHNYRVLVVYFSGVLAGSLGNSVVDPKMFLAGASGGGYALITAHVSTIIMNWSEMEFPLIQLLIFIIFLIVQVGIALYDRYDNISHSAHFAGALAGLLIGIWNLKKFDSTKDMDSTNKKNEYAWWCALSMFIVFIGSMIILNIVWKDHFLTG